MKYLVLIITVLNLASCGFSGDEIDDENQDVSQIDQIRLNKLDSDGDLVADVVELINGRNPFVADLPDIRTQFLQNYKITVSYKELISGKEGQFIIDTKVGLNDPAFHYRVGDVLLRNNSLKNASRVGKFSGHSWGSFEEHDLTWVQYPEVDSRFHQSNVMRYLKYFDETKFDISNISIELENSVQLKGNTEFKALKNLRVSYIFYNYETEINEVMHSEVIKRQFNSGVNEKFTIKIDNVNPKLISENYFKKSEFVISELTDYEIPQMQSSFKRMMSSIRQKALPVILNTPLGTSVEYVSIGENSKFIDVMQQLYDEKIKVLNNELVSINQFKNTLPSYVYLKELKEIGKKGRWFIFTNKLKQHYLDHDFSNKDIISLSYILGAELAKQKEKRAFTYIDTLATGDKFKVHELGKVKPNSEVHIFLESQSSIGKVHPHLRISI